MKKTGYILLVIIVCIVLYCIVIPVQMLLGVKCSTTQQRYHTSAG